MSKKLYVGNLSYSATDESLEALFAPYGAVQSAQVILDRDTGRSKGFGFVEMADANGAQEAVRHLNESSQDGRPIVVNEAKPREDRGPSRGGSRGGYGRR